MNIDGENEVPPWEDQDGAQEDDHLGETEDKAKNKPNGASPQEEIAIDTMSSMLSLPCSRLEAGSFL